MELRPETDGITSSLREAEAVEEDALLSASPDLLWRLYRQRGVAVLQHYGQTMQRRFPASVPLGQCLIYPDRPADRIMRIQWRATLHAKNAAVMRVLKVILALITHIHLGEKLTYVDFYTFHGFSGAGVSKVRTNRALRWWMKLGGAALLILSVPTGVCLGIAAANETRPEIATVEWVVAVVAWLLVVLSAVGIYLSLRLEVPASLLFIARRPFKFKSMQTVQKLIRRSSAQAQSDAILSEEY
jgi:hypothetical protein